MNALSKLNSISLKFYVLSEKKVKNHHIFGRWGNEISDIINKRYLFFWNNINNPNLNGRNPHRKRPNFLFNLHWRICSVFIKLKLNSKPKLVTYIWVVFGLL